MTTVDKVRLCTQVLLEKSALDPVVLDVRTLSSFTDYFIICSGQSSRQVVALARYVEDAMIDVGVKPLGREGMEEGRWVLLDFNDVIIHIFHQPVREFYDLEGLWSEAIHQDIDLLPAFYPKAMQVTQEAGG